METNAMENVVDKTAASSETLAPATTEQQNKRFWITVRYENNLYIAAFGTIDSNRLGHTERLTIGKALSSLSASDARTGAVRKLKRRFENVARDDIEMS